MLFLATNNLYNYTKGKTITNISKSTGISRTLLSQFYNSGLIPDKTRFDVLEKISKVLKVPISWLFTQDNSWTVTSMDQIHTDFSYSDGIATYLVTVNSSIFGEKKPLYISIEFSKSYKMITIEFLTIKDINMLQKVSNKFYKNVPEDCLNFDTQYMESLNIHSARDIADSIASSKLFAKAFNNFISTPKIKSIDSGFKIRLHLQSVDMPMINLNNVCIITDDADDMINTFNNENILRLFSLYKNK